MAECSGDLALGGPQPKLRIAAACIAVASQRLNPSPPEAQRAVIPQPSPIGLGTAAPTFWHPNGGRYRSIPNVFFIKGHRSFQELSRNHAMETQVVEPWIFAQGEE